MKRFVALTSRPTGRLTRFVLALSLMVAVTMCTRPESEPGTGTLTENESYLVDAYVRINLARDIHAVTYLKSESLFTALDSTIDTLRIANTIRKLEATPDRWLLIFRSIENALNRAKEAAEEKPPAEASEETGRGPDAAAEVDSHDESHQ